MLEPPGSVRGGFVLSRIATVRIDREGAKATDLGSAKRFRTRM
jgi:hypothetical protein